MRSAAVLPRLEVGGGGFSTGAAAVPSMEGAGETAASCTNAIACRSLAAGPGSAGSLSLSLSELALSCEVDACVAGILPQSFSPTFSNPFSLMAEYDHTRSASTVNFSERVAGSERLWPLSSNDLRLGRHTQHQGRITQCHCNIYITILLVDSAIRLIGLASRKPIQDSRSNDRYYF